MANISMVLSPDHMYSMSVLGSLIPTRVLTVEFWDTHM